MSDEIKTTDTELLTELSESEQEAVTGGVSLADDFASFFFQQTAIETFADDQTTLSANGGNPKVSSSSKTGYKFFQTTLAFSIPVFSKRRSRGGANMSIGSLFNFLQNL
jgi:hypothetical protein